MAMEMIMATVAAVVTVIVAATAMMMGWRW